MNKSIRDAIGQRAEYIRQLAQEAGEDNNREKEIELWGYYKGLTWVEELLGIDWAIYNRKAVILSNRIHCRAKDEKISDDDKIDWDDI